MNKPWKDITIYDIAEKLNLSASTVSRALNNHPIIKEKTRKLVQATAEEMNFTFNMLPERPVPVSRRVIGVIIPFLNEEGMADAIAGILEMSEQFGYDVIISQSQGLLTKESQLVREMFKKKVDGLLICLAYEKREMNHFDKYQKFNVPVCSFHKVWNHPYSGQVYINNLRATYDLTTHLIDQGCLSIAYVSGPALNNIYQDRLEGYRAAFKDRKLKYDPKLVFTTTLNADGGKRIANQIMSLNRLPHALIVNDDICAISCMKALQEQGIHIPGDLLIAGFNNHIVSTFSEPTLTTVDVPRHQMGQQALTQLINQIQYKGLEKNSPFRMCMEHRLLVRASSMRSNYEKNSIRVLNA